MTIAKINAGGVSYGIASTAYAYCKTAANEAAKAAVLESSIADGGLEIPFTLITGTTIHIKFQNSNTASSPTLKVGTAAAKPIVRYGTTAAGTTAVTSWTAGAVISFTYDGTSWIMNGFVENTDTHYTTHLYVGDGTAADKATTNGNTKITVTDNTTVRNSAVIKGTAPLSVVSDASKNITISASNATTSAAGLMSASDKTFLNSLSSSPLFKTAIVEIASGSTSVTVPSTAQIHSYIARQSGSEVIVDSTVNSSNATVFSVASSLTTAVSIYIVYTGSLS